ncbi:MAG TPA: hypothetical protein PKB14_02975 [Rubrivivax sp.]|nr:hypothetical protein [Rubrivivax sp.]
MFSRKIGRRTCRSCADAPAASAASGLEPIISGTLALLPQCARMPDLGVSERIAFDPALIARHPEASAALQTACAGLFAAQEPVGLGIGPDRLLVQCSTLCST